MTTAKMPLRSSPPQAQSQSTPRVKGVSIKSRTAPTALMPKLRAAPKNRRLISATQAKSSQAYPSMVKNRSKMDSVIKIPP